METAWQHSPSCYTKLISCSMFGDFFFHEIKTVRRILILQPCMMATFYVDGFQYHSLSLLIGFPNKLAGFEETWGLLLPLCTLTLAGSEGDALTCFLVPIVPVTSKASN